MTVLRIRGFEFHKNLLALDQQKDIVDRLRDVLAQAPLFRPMTPYGKPMSVRMSSAGKFGWFADKSGYRYVGHHPNGQSWPEIPPPILKVWHSVSGVQREPESCLINFYDGDARMALHQDKDEVDMTMPVVSISLGDSALFRIGNQTRGGKTEPLWLDSGDVAVMGGDARLTYHGIDRIRHGSSSLLSKGGRINLTLRVVT